MPGHHPTDPATGTALAWPGLMEGPSACRDGLNIAGSVALRCIGKWSSGNPIMEQRQCAYAALAGDCERAVDEVGGAEVTLGWLHG